MIDIHNHTTFSDGRDSADEVVRSAAISGLQVIGISDHFDPYVSRQDVCLQPNEIDAYVKELEELKDKYQIKLLSGLEIGLQSMGIVWPGVEFDYYIYSVHTVPGLPELKDLEDPWEIYLDEVIMAVELIDRPGFLGHLDFLRRHIPGATPPSPGAQMDMLLRKLVENDIGLEMNTSGWLYNLGDSTPQRWVIERYIELGGHLITLGSDSHRAVNVGSYISKAIGVLEELAVKQVFYAENGCYVPFNIQEMV